MSAAAPFRSGVFRCVMMPPSEMTRISMPFAFRSVNVSTDCPSAEVPKAARVIAGGGVGAAGGDGGGGPPVLLTAKPQLPHPAAAPARISTIAYLDTRISALRFRAL